MSKFYVLILIPILPGFTVLQWLTFEQDWNFMVNVAFGMDASSRK